MSCASTRSPVDVTRSSPEGDLFRYGDEGAHVARGTRRAGGHGRRPRDPTAHGRHHPPYLMRICGSDLHLYEVLGAFIDPGDVLGHEPIGTSKRETVVEEIMPLLSGDD